jgi:hypothetical protein
MYLSIAVLPPINSNDITSFEYMNKSQGISGILIFIESAGLYVQTLDGPEDRILSLWESICRDTRHRSPRIVYTKSSVGTWKASMDALSFVSIPTQSAPLSQNLSMITPSRPTSPITIWALDDVALIRKLTGRLLTSLPGSIQYKVCGVSDHEINRFVHSVLVASPPVQVVILDNILSSPTHSAPTIYGLDIARELTTSGFMGTIIMSSANDLTHPYVNMPKDMSFTAKRQLLVSILSDLTHKSLPT